LAAHEIFVQARHSFFHGLKAFVVLLLPSDNLRVSLPRFAPLVVDDASGSPAFKVNGFAITRFGWP
jgi:hypothetical protein